MKTTILYRAISSIMFLFLLTSCPKNLDPKIVSPQKETISGINLISSGLNTGLGVNTFVGENTSTGVNTTVGGNLNTTTGVNTLTGENTIGGENINTSTGVNTTVGGNIDPEEIFPNDTVYYGKYKPFFYAGFDTTKKANEIKLYDLRTYSLQNFNGLLSCDGVIATNEEYQKSCDFRIESVTGTNIKWVLTTLPAFDFSKHSIFLILESKSRYLYDFIASKLYQNDTDYEFIKYMTYKKNMCGTLGILYHTSQSFVTDKPLKVGNEFKEIDLIRAKCVSDIGTEIYKSDTTDYFNYTNYIVK